MSINDNKIDKVRTMLHEDHHLTIHEIAEGLGITMGSCHTILTGKLNMHRISAKFVPRLLSTDISYLCDYIF